MRLPKITSVTVYIIFILIVLVGMLAHAQASDMPALPAFFYGKATYNGKNVPINSVVTAKIDNEKRGSIKVDAAGFYGSETGDKKLAAIGSRSSLGKNVEFYVKIPKLQEIKATQTFRWQSGSETKLDLTFNGQEIEDNSTEILEEIVNSTKQSFSYVRITAGKQVLIFIENPNIPIIRLQLLTTANLTNVTFDFEVVEQPIAPKLEGVYKYISINAPKIEDSVVKTAILRFKVPNEWFEINGYDPATVNLLRYHNNNWDVLETFHEGADAADNYYRAGTPGFSYFAIKAGKYVPKANATANALSREQEEAKKAEDKEEKEDKQSFSPVQTANQITGFAVEKFKTNPVIGVVLVLVGVLLGILATYYFVVGNKTEKTEREIKTGEIKTKQETKTEQEIQTIDDIQEQETQTIQEIQSIEDLQALDDIQSTGSIQTEQKTQTIDDLQLIEDAQTEKEAQPIQEIHSIDELQLIDDIQTEQNTQTIDDLQLEDAQSEQGKQKTKIKLEVK